MVIEMEEKILKPTLRFKGFTDTWEQCKLSDVVISHNAGVYISKDNYGEGSNIIGVGDIYNRDAINGEIYRLAPVEDDRFLLKKGDLIYGESSLVPEGIARTMYVDDKGAGTAFAWHTRRVELDLKKVNSHLLTLQINYSNKSRNHLMRVSTQTALTGMTTEGYFSTPITFPSLEEQYKISKVFTELDKLITLHQRKYDKLVNIKKALLDRMFPNNGDIVPELRFKGFADTWEQCKVGELGSIVTGNTPPTAITDYYSDDGLIWVTPTDINQNITTSTTRMLSEKGESVARVVPPKTILVTCIASIGKNTLLGSKGSFNQQINALIPAQKNDPYFLFTQSNHWSSHMKRLGAALTFQIVNKKEFSEIDTLVPQPDEQKKIGSLFNQIDSLITLHQRKYEKLVNIKKALLQKMFV